jgi:hypothetical protein
MKTVCKTLLKKTHRKNWAGGVAQGVGPESKPQYCKKKKNPKKQKHAEAVLFLWLQQSQ